MTTKIKGYDKRKGMSERLTIVPIFQKDANRFVLKHHRHSINTVGAIFQVGLKQGNELVGVAICGRPIAQAIDYKIVLEVYRNCIDKDKEIKNGCSKLYGVCARIAKEMGYKKIITFTKMSEPGTSLKASGWFIEAENVGCKNGKPWNSSGDRIRVNVDMFGNKKYSEEPKRRWAKLLISEPNVQERDATEADSSTGDDNQNL